MSNYWKGVLDRFSAIVIFCAILQVGHWVVTAHAESELEASARLAPKYHARAEVVLDDQTRVDLLSDTLAIEVEWAKKSYEAIGQSLYYGIKTGRKPAIVLLVTDPTKERRYVDRCRVVCEEYGIQLFTEPAKKGR